MATRRFCDICDTPLTPEDDQPFVRVYSPTRIPAPNKVVGHVMIMNEHNHVLTDVCNGCKLIVVNEGTPQVATLQSTGASAQVSQPATPAVLVPTPVLPFTPSIPPAPASRGEEL